MRGLTAQEHAELADFDGPGADHFMSEDECALLSSLITAGRVHIEEEAHEADHGCALCGYVEPDTDCIHDSYTITDLGRLALRLWPLNRMETT